MEIGINIRSGVIVTNKLKLIPKNVILTQGRLFINIALSGCGNGCLYCYISGSKEKQKLLDEWSFTESLNYVKQHLDFIPGKLGTLISLCPDSEPFKSEQSTKLVVSILKSFLPLGNPIQISTKQLIPDLVFSIIEKEINYTGQVVIFISNSTISEVSIFEPYATQLPQRFGNIKRSRDFGIISCLYIKPFLQSTANDVKHYIEVVNHYQPNMICVGIMYQIEPFVNKNSVFHHPVHPDRLFSLGLTNEIIDFRMQIIKSVYTPIFYSSLCVSAYARNWFPSPRIWLDFPELCVECRNCKENYQNYNSKG